MSDEKYYHPSIEEFHVGFEYEVLAPDAEIRSANRGGHFDYEAVVTSEPYWRSKVIDIDMGNLPLLHLQQLLNKEEIRVKRLGREDIEACGWEYVEQDKTNPEYHLYRSGEYWLDAKDDGSLEIRNDKVYEQADPCWVYFCGTIRNRSELLKLMQMIGVK